jgi:hypothetical protein
MLLLLLLLFLSSVLVAVSFCRDNAVDICSIYRHDIVIDAVVTAFDSYCYCWLLWLLFSPVMSEQGLPDKQTIRKPSAGAGRTGQQFTHEGGTALCSVQMRFCHLEEATLG